jgi:uncharacterized protein (TIGR03000 family)
VYPEIFMRSLVVSMAAVLFSGAVPLTASADHGCNSCGNSAAGFTQGGELPACSFCATGGPVCAPPACGICGTNVGWDCSHEEGIDVESLTPEAQSKKLYEASMARIIVVLPEDAGVSLLDQKMTTLGVKRTFVVSVNDQSKDYKYEVKVDVVRNGKKYFRKLKIEDLRAGMILVVVVAAPPIPEGEPAVIEFGKEVLAVGGNPDAAPPVDPPADDAPVNVSAAE